MMENFRQALVAGFERLTAWADLLDRINVFPVADGDTGRNLVISLAPLRLTERDTKDLSRDLLLSARGNSGNIASWFFHCFIHADAKDTLPEIVRMGRDRAWHAVSDPRQGTMLSFFDALASGIYDTETISDSEQIALLLKKLETVVRDTTEELPKLAKAGVVDAGALGMFLFFEGFFHVLTGGRIQLCSVTETFRDRLQVPLSYSEGPEAGYCVDTVLRSEANTEEAAKIISSLGESVVITRNDDYLKVHFHTGDREEARRKLINFGQVINWAEDDLFQQTSAFSITRQEQAIHIMTDAAGSLTREDAKTLGISLLDSYITIGSRSLPETYFKPEELYDAMEKEIRVTTAQASIFERCQIYASVASRYEQVLYLCVGSVFTGNYRVVMDWKREHDPENRLIVIDTGTASGRLAVIAHAVSTYASEVDELGLVVEFAKRAVARSEEYVFLDKLEYLAAGGRLSKTGAFFGDMLHMKPIVSPMPEGARKVGVVRNRKDQVRFACEAMERSLRQDENALIMLEYSDNRPWVEELSHEVAERRPQSRIIVNPLSLTTGAHTGPGTWAVAFLPDLQ
jgi:DegV family protein with EDD domain